jgi:hypothetical protein
MRDKECPECKWVAVVDAAGRRRIEMRWASPVAPAAEPASRAA